MFEIRNYKIDKVEKSSTSDLIEYGYITYRDIADMYQQYIGFDELDLGYYEAGQPFPQEKNATLVKIDQAIARAVDTFENKTSIPLLPTITHAKIQVRQSYFHNRYDNRAYYSIHNRAFREILSSEFLNGRDNFWNNANGFIESQKNSDDLFFEIIIPEPILDLQLTKIHNLKIVFKCCACNEEDKTLNPTIKQALLLETLLQLLSGTQGDMTCDLIKLYSTILGMNGNCYCAS